MSVVGNMTTIGGLSKSIRSLMEKWLILSVVQKMVPPLEFSKKKQKIVLLSEKQSLGKQLLNKKIKKEKIKIW